MLLTSLDTKTTTPAQHIKKNLLDPALVCKNVSKSYSGNVGVSNFTIEIQQGEIISLLGPSGCGKTTLLHLIGGFIQPDYGTITIGDTNVVHNGFSLAPEKRNIGMVFQEGALFPHLTVEQNVSYGVPKSKRRTGEVDNVLKLVRLEHLRNRMPHELSGGQQQRVALARALAPQPEIILLDEPFSNLDPSLRMQVRDDMLEIIKASKVTAIFVTHDQEEALLIGDRVAVMSEGSLEQIGSAEAIFHYPANKFTANFVGNVDFVQGECNDHIITSEIGSVHYSKTVEEDDLLELMSRPDCLDCYPCPEGANHIVSRQFRGAFYMYTVSLPSGNTVKCLLPHTHEYNVGDAVNIILREGHSLLPFKNGFLDADILH
ncbi:MAG: ABC transporter ATP-binding protein [Chloroflexota bacterium]|nr:ABC transporter ATP-binding protein [Chloroflexota bacterium]